MENKRITIGSLITSETVHHNSATGYVTAILNNTLVIRDHDTYSHLIKKSVLKATGYSISTKQTNYKPEVNPDRSHQRTSSNLIVEKKPQPKINKISNDELIEDVQKMAVTMGKTPASKDFSHVKLITSRFGSWNPFVEAAGLEVNSRYYSDQFLFDEVKLLAQKLGRSPFTKEFPYYTTIYRRFDSWNDFLSKADLTPSKHYTIKTNDFLLQEVRDLAKHLNRKPVYRDYPDATLASRRFGSWNAFLKAADIK
ncbi:hypothetical protein DOK76_12925 [Vagococcus sp. DIV0080]|uniref:Uncharacterized protein n=1 Tax=Candidatus Vagococcus giribetii TaxID=2230876 RepID=A0ABS3HW38_9ENTE|nr:hypothetical protein [Vagococcus sp. DIV0080]MBO0477969.1 hypothetical protein [Vagococcus sp. DIV0080]